MARLRRRCRVAKWAGASCYVVVLVVFALSAVFSLGYTAADSICWKLNNGCVQRLPMDLSRAAAGWSLSVHLPRLWWRPRFYWISLDFPLWIPLLFVTLPTAYLFWLDHRRIPPHCCQTCSYDLTGNTSGVCPECGVKA